MDLVNQPSASLLATTLPTHSPLFWLFALVVGGAVVATSFLGPYLAMRYTRRSRQESGSQSAVPEKAWIWIGAIMSVFAAVAVVGGVVIGSASPRVSSIPARVWVAIGIFAGWPVLRAGTYLPSMRSWPRDLARSSDVRVKRVKLAISIAFILADWVMVAICAYLLLTSPFRVWGQGLLVFWLAAWSLFVIAIATVLVRRKHASLAAR